MRLVNGTTIFEGRVELCYRGMWGLVCDNTWDSNDAATVCQILGFPQDGIIIFVFKLWDTIFSYFQESPFRGLPLLYTLNHSLAIATLH